MVATYADQIIAAAQAAGLSAQIIGTGGGCEAIEVRKEGVPRFALVTNWDAQLPGMSDEDDTVIVGAYADADDDDALGYEEASAPSPVAVVAMIETALTR